MGQPTKAALVLQAAVSNGAGSTTQGTGQDLRTIDGALITGLITNGATPPTVGCDFVLEISNDGTNWREYVRATAPVAANTTYYFPVELPRSVMWVRSKFSGNTGQAVDVACDGAEITAY